MDNALIPYAELQHDFSINITENLSYEDLKQQLSKAVAILLMKDTQRLFAYLYRIDVSEVKVKAIIQDPEVADKLAELILQKLMEKAYWRNKYRSDGNSPSY